MWMVRAGEGGYLIEDFKNKNYVAIGWNELTDLSKIADKEKIKKLVVEKCEYCTKQSQVNVAAGQISRFLMDFKKGDYVLSYDPNKRVYLVGEIQSDYEYDEKFSKYHHIRKVKWLGEVSRDKLSTHTRNTLGAISTIFLIGDSAATEIIGILEGKQEVPKVPEETEEEDLKEDMVSRANELIKDHIMQLDWKDMQKLVAGILRAMGYKTSISEEGSDRGRDIEASPDGLMLTEPRILVEVKHRYGQMGSKEIRNFHTS
jgi:restriction system protein